MERLVASEVAACALALFGSAADVASAQTPGFHLIGSAPGTTFSTAVALSADGRVATGYSSPGTQPGFIWSEVSGRYDFGLEPDVPSSAPLAISGDGSTVVGQSASGSFRWRGSGTYQSLGTFGPYPVSAGRGVSGDGSVVVGFAEIPMSFSSQAFRWTQATGMVGLGYTRPGHTQSEARAISRDGNTIVGWSMGTVQDAFAWTQGGGMQILPRLAGSTSDSLLARGVNHDGSRIVGYDGRAVRAIMWTPGGAQDLGNAPGWFGSEAFGVSDDGSVVLGNLLNSTQYVPAVWTPSTGFVPFLDYLAQNGITIPAGYTIDSVNAMSGDGRSFCGDLLGAGSIQAFVVTVPAPTALVFAALGGAGAAMRRRR